MRPTTADSKSHELLTCKCHESDFSSTLEET